MDAAANLLKLIDGYAFTVSYWTPSVKLLSGMCSDEVSCAPFFEYTNYYLWFGKERVHWNIYFLHLKIRSFLGNNNILVPVILVWLMSMGTVIEFSSSFLLFVLFSLMVWGKVKILSSQLSFSPTFINSWFQDGETKLTFYASLLLPLRKFTYKDKKSKQASFTR